jgi:hypothetical protein
MGLPSEPLASPLKEDVHRAGLWARDHVPAACVDYLVPHWVTAYWLHLDVLGNPRLTERMEQETFEYRISLGRWILPGGLPYGVAEDVDRLPPDVRQNIRILERFNAAAVIERTDGKSRCDDRSLPIRDATFRR